MDKSRIEQDNLGQLKLPQDCLWGIHTQRALDNFDLGGRPVHRALVHGYGAVKLACARTNHELGYLADQVFTPIEKACTEVMEGLLDEHVAVNALQGGAGTSTNMNINEVIANRALQLIGERPGTYQLIDPIEHINLHQSTNDTYPTALRLAAIQLFRQLEREVIALTETFQEKEKEFAHIVKVGRTQLQEAVLTTLGREMSAYADALARDRWRIYKCEERLRVVNLGGTAIGTGITAPRQYIFKVVEQLKSITGIGLARAENLVEATQNTDVFVEVSGILKAYATSLLKSANDLRLLSAGPQTGFREINLPVRQAGSSIMPDKINPVIPEAVIQCALQVMGNDQTLSIASSQGNLELNAFIPLIANCLLTNLNTLINVTAIYRKYCVAGITANQAACQQGVETSTATITALVEKLGYKIAVELSQAAVQSGKSLKQLALEKKLLTTAEFESLVAPEHVNRLGSK